MMLHIPAVLNVAELHLMQERLQQAESSALWTDGRLTAGDQSAQTKNNQQLPQSSALAQDLSLQVSQAFARNPLFVTGALPKKVYPPLFNRYSGQNNAFGEHIDNAVRTDAATARHVRTDLSCTLFLSDPASYEGGELVVMSNFGEQLIKLNAGDAVLYPGTSVHRVNPVTRGARVASFFWIESMVRRQDQRQLLFDMDMAILALRQQAQTQVNQGLNKTSKKSVFTESVELVKLTGCYHNLLRMWAEV
jgi:PKHD-type hydroxylase